MNRKIEMKLNRPATFTVRNALSEALQTVTNPIVKKWVDDSLNKKPKKLNERTKNTHIIRIKGGPNIKITNSKS